MKGYVRLLFVLLILPTTLWAEGRPVEVVQAATDAVLGELEQNPGIRSDPQALNRVVRRHVAPHIDFVTLSRLALGRNWRRATPPQRERFVREFSRLLVRVYSTALAEYANQSIEYLPTSLNADGRRATVRSRIVHPGQAPLAIDYSLRRSQGAWKIYDVKIEGVSLAFNYRAGFAEQVSAGGIEGLIEGLVRQNSARAEVAVLPVRR